MQNTCTLKEHKFFDTHFSRAEANKLARYLYFLPYDTHVIVLTLGEAFSNMTDSAYEEFDNLGVEIGDMVEVGHTFVALIVVGSQCNTMYELYEDEPAYLYCQLNGRLVCAEVVSSRCEMNVFYTADSGFRPLHTLISRFRTARLSVV